MNTFFKRSLSTRHWSRTFVRGFTVVELITVISIIGILASITIVNYRATQQRARNVARMDEVDKIKDVLNLYYGYNKAYPTEIMTAGVMFCVGGGFPDVDADSIGECRDVNGGNINEENATLDAKLAAIQPLKPGPRMLINSMYVGPYVSTNSISPISIQVVNFFEGDECPDGYIDTWVGAPAGVSMCYVNLI